MLRKFRKLSRVDTILKTTRAVFLALPQLFVHFVSISRVFNGDAIRYLDDNQFKRNTKPLRQAQTTRIVHTVVDDSCYCTL